VLRDADIIADGKPREASIPMRLVRYQLQALRVAEIQRRLGRLWWRANVKLGPRFCELEEGDWIAWQSDRYFDGATIVFRIESYAIDKEWQPALTLRQISASVFADDAVDTWPPDLSEHNPSPPPPDVGSPEPDNWTLTAITLDSAGASVPALAIAGSADDDDYAEAIIFEYWRDDGVTDPVANPDTPAWITYGRLAPATTRVEITSIVGGATYYAAVSYVVGGEAATDSSWGRLGQPELSCGVEGRLLRGDGRRQDRRRCRDGGRDRRRLFRDCRQCRRHAGGRRRIVGHPRARFGRRGRRSSGRQQPVRLGERRDRAN
jgi:hypothetical protein